SHARDDRAAAADHPSGRGGGERERDFEARRLGPAEEHERRRRADRRGAGQVARPDGQDQRIARSLRMPVRGIRGAINVASNTKGEILSKSKRLLEAMIRANRVKAADVAAAIFTLTPDLNAEFPAIAARQLGWNNVPLLCAG